MSSIGEPPTIGAGQPLPVRLRGWLFSLLMLMSALLGVIFIITPILPLIVFNPKLWRKCMDRLVGVWVIMPGALMTYLFGATVKVRGDAIEHGEPAVIIMNHRTRLDWLFFWNALYKIDPWLCTSEKISLKGILKYVPGAGWAMGCNSYIFLDRSFDTDKSKLDSILDYYASAGYNYQLLLFPEGTDKCPKATERSRVFSEKKGLTHYDYLLHPRTTGFVHIVQNMRKANYIKYLYDVTIGFGDVIVQSEEDLVAHGACPKEVFYQIRKMPIDSLPADDEGLALWLTNLWKEKEAKLRDFYSIPREHRHFENTKGGQDFEMNEQTSRIQLFIVLFWLFTTFFWVAAIFKVNFMFYFSIFSCIIFVCIQKLFGGVEWLAIQKFNEHRTAEAQARQTVEADGHPSEPEI